MMFTSRLRSKLRLVTRGRWPEVRADEALTCGEVGRLLQRFVDGELDDPAATGALAAHLDVCEPCDMEADTYRRIKAALLAHRDDPGAAPIERLRHFGERLMEH